MSGVDYYGQLFNGDVITPAIARAANIAKTYGLALVQARTPVDSGNLKSNWKAKLEGNGIRWSNETPYSSFVEFGTKKMAARSMLSASIPDITAVFEEEISKEMGKALGASIGASIVSEAAIPTYNNQGSAKVAGGLAKRNFSKQYLFSNPSDILSGKQKAQAAKAKPLLQRKGR